MNGALTTLVIMCVLVVANTAIVGYFTRRTAAALHEQHAKVISAVLKALDASIGQLQRARLDMTGPDFLDRLMGTDITTPPADPTAAESSWRRFLRQTDTPPPEQEPPT